MPPAGIRKAGGPARMVFDGQSRCNYPAPPLSVPSLLMTGRGVPWSNCSIDGYGWNFLQSDEATRLWPLASLNTATGLWLSGGEGDIGGGATAATIITRITNYANDARAAGFAPIAATTILGAGGGQFDAAEEAVRLEYNGLLIAMHGGAVLDHVVDLEEGGAGPMVYADGSPYYDETLLHYSVTGAREVARICLATHEAMLAVLLP